MKRNIIYLVLLLSCISLFATERTEEQMRDAAISVLNNNRHIRSNRANGVSSELMLMKRMPKLSVYGYADGGFAVISVDDRYSEVIGYSDTHYSDSVMPCGFKWWIEAVNAAMSVEGNVTAFGRYAKRRGANSKVEPMIKTRWGQDNPYNRFCTHDGYKLLTGCVATSMAQIMNYHHYPDKGTGSHSYSINSNDWGTVTYSSNFEDHIYDWGNMLDDYIYGYNDIQADAVALLMKDCGVSVNMEYTTYNSTAYQYDMLQALKNYFSYSQDTYYQYRYGVIRDVWMEKVYSELDNGHPIAYRGNAQNGSEGHAFVLDGYDEEGNVHVNWGWNGIFDGYFDIDALNPSGYNFSYDQAMIVPIPGDRKSSYDLIYYVDGAVYKKYKVNVGDAITPEPAPTKAGRSFTGWSTIPAVMPDYSVLVYGTFIDEENIDGHEFIDLALPSGNAWATVNYGASTETGCGTYVDWNDNNVVSQSWGSQWKTPARADFQELINNCTWEWESRDGVNGYKVTGRNGNSIFLPAAGFQIYGYDQSVNSALYYWTSTSSYSSGFSYVLWGNSTGYDANTTYNTSLVTCPIRPISQVPAEYKRYMLRYMVDGVEYKTLFLKEGEAIIPEPMPVKEGYTFSGWSDIPATMPAHDITVTGSFKKDNFKLSIEDIKAYLGKTITLPIELVNSGDVKLFQFDLRLPDGVTVSMTSDEKLDVTLTERAVSHNVKGRKLSNGDYRFIIYSLGNDAITGEEGVLVNVNLAISQEMSVGDNTIKILNTEFGVAVAKGFKAISQEAVESNLTVKSYTTGDANGDSRVNVTDIVEIVNCIMGNPSERFVFPAADVNDDGDVNVTDIVGIINIIMSDKSYAPSVSGRRTAEVLDFAQYTAAQFEVKVTDGTTVDKIRLVENMEQTHQLMYQKKDANTYVVLVYSLSNELMQPENGEIIEIECNADAVIVENVMVVTPMGDAEYCETMPGTTGVRPIEDENTPAVIYNLKGNRIDNAKEKGVYIINNKKYIAK